MVEKMMQTKIHMQIKIYVLISVRWNTYAQIKFCVNYSGRNHESHS